MVVALNLQMRIGISGVLSVRLNQTLIVRPRLLRNAAAAAPQYHTTTYHTPRIYRLIRLHTYSSSIVARAYNTYRPPGTAIL